MKNTQTAPGEASIQIPISKNTAVLVSYSRKDKHMMSFKATVSYIAIKRKIGESYKSISSELGMDKLGISKADVRRIGMGHYPGEVIAKRLGWLVKCSRCHRAIPKPRVKVVVPRIGQAGWLDAWLKPIRAQGKAK